MKRLTYAIKGLRLEGNELTEPVLVATSLQRAVKLWQQNHTVKTAIIEVRQDTHSGYRMAGELMLNL